MTHDYTEKLIESRPQLLDISSITNPTKNSLLDFYSSPLLMGNPFKDPSGIMVEKTSNTIGGGAVDSFQWELSPNGMANTVKLKELSFYDSGAVSLKPKEGHWVRVLIVTEEDDFFQDETTSSNQILTMGDLDSTAYRTTNATAFAALVALSNRVGMNLYSYTEHDSFIDVVLIGDNDDYMSLDIDGDVSGIATWKLQIDNVNHGSGSENDNDSWVTMVSYGTTKNGLPYKNSWGNYVSHDGYEVSCEQGDFNWDTQFCTWIDKEEIVHEEDPIIDPIDDPPNGGGGVTVDPPKEGLELLYINFRSGRNNPFSRYELFGDYEFQNDGNKLRLVDHWKSFTTYDDSGGVYMTIKDGYYLDIEIKTEEGKYFNELASKFSVDSQVISTSLNDSNPSFKYRLYGGNSLAIDIDVLFGFKVTNQLTGLQTALSFYLNGNEQTYAIADSINNEVELKYIGWGMAEYVPEPTDGECPDGWVYDPLTEECVQVDITTPPVTTGPTDPFDLFDDLGAPFEEDDGLITRLTKSAVFAVKGSAKAIEAVIEGSLLALPAVVVIGSAVVAGMWIIKRVDRTAQKVEEINVQTSLINKIPRLTTKEVLPNDVKL